MKKWQYLPDDINEFLNYSNKKAIDIRWFLYCQLGMRKKGT